MGAISVFPFHMRSTWPFILPTQTMDLSLHWTRREKKTTKHVSSKNGDDRADRNVLPKQETQQHGHQKMAEMHQFMKILKLLRISMRQPMTGYFLSFNYSDDLSPPLLPLVQVPQIHVPLQRNTICIYISLYVCAAFRTNTFVCVGILFCDAQIRLKSLPPPFFFFLLKWQMHLSMVV